MVMIERIVRLTPEMAYEELRKILLKQKCKITEEDSPKTITVEHGSLWEYSPRTAQKKISFHLVPHNSHTRIVSITSLTSSHFAWAIFGVVLAAFGSGFFWWFALDMEAEIKGLEQLGYTGFEGALILVNVLKILALILVIILGISIIHEIYIYAQREAVAKELLSLLP